MPKKVQRLCGQKFVWKVIYILKVQIGAAHKKPLQCLLIVPCFSLTAVTVNDAHSPRPLDVLSPDEDEDEDVDDGEEGHRHEPRDHQPRPVDVVVDVPRV